MLKILIPAVALAAALPLIGGAGHAKAVAIPAPARDVPPAPALQTAVLAGGCFWGMEAVFEGVKGVRDVVSGYAGGTRDTATYAQVSTERQHPDSGPSYRSAIFPQTPQQQLVAEQYVAQLGRTRAFGKPIATRIERGAFYPAEAYHQDFARRNPTHGYIVTWDKPKIAAFRAAYPSLVK
jgi:peptide-methionine (S)-S-oxide reductase